MLLIADAVELGVSIFPSSPARRQGRSDPMHSMDSKLTNKQVVQCAETIRSAMLQLWPGYIGDPSNVQTASDGPKPLFIGGATSQMPPFEECFRGVE